MTDHAADRAERTRVADAYARRPVSDWRYSWFNPSLVHTIQERERRTLRALARAGVRDLAACRVLDLGAGTGFWLRMFHKWGAVPERVVGLDVLRDRLRAARAAGPSGAPVLQASGVHLPFADASFDLVHQSTVFSSILSADVRAAVAAEMRRVLRPGGILIWYDYFLDNPSNADVRGVRRHEIVELFPQSTIHLERVTLAPPLARRVSRWSGWSYALLNAFPLFRTHYLGIIRPHRAAEVGARE